MLKYLNIQANTNRKSRTQVKDSDMFITISPISVLCVLLAVLCTLLIVLCTFVHSLLGVVRKILNLLSNGNTKAVGAATAYRPHSNEFANESVSQIYKAAGILRSVHDTLAKHG